MQENVVTTDKLFHSAITGRDYVSPRDMKRAELNWLNAHKNKKESTKILEEKVPNLIQPKQKFETKIQPKGTVAPLTPR